MDKSFFINIMILYLNKHFVRFEKISRSLNEFIQKFLVWIYICTQYLACNDNRNILQEID